MADRRDEAIGKLALALQLVDAAALSRAMKLSAQFPGRSLDLLLELAGFIDPPARRKLVLAFNERCKQGAGFQPLPVPGAPPAAKGPPPRSGPLPAKVAPARPAPPASKPPAPARSPGLAGRDLDDSDLLAVPPDDDATPALAVPEDEDAILAQPTMVLRDEDESQPPVVMVDSAEVEPPTDPTLLSQSQEDALYAEPTIVMRDTAPGSAQRLSADADRIVRDEPAPKAHAKPPVSDEDAIFAEPTMVLKDAPESDEDAILAQPTMVLRDSGEHAPPDDIYAQPTMVLKDSGEHPGPPESESGPIAVDLRLGRDVGLSESQKLKGKGGPMPGVRSKKGEGPLTRDEFQRRLKMRQGFEGFSIGDYKVVTEIARGAFGVVLQVEAGGTARSLARDRGYDGTMALKVMLENKVDPRETQRFLDEVKVLIRFDHPHIVRMFDAGVEQGLTYYSMELIKGVETRSHVLKHGPMPALLAVRVGKEVASALAYVHQQRTYHRDLKPQNIMLDQRTQPYKALLIDFGLVTEHLSGADKGLILGTPSYMPPEQAQPRGGHGEVNVTSDLYSLGASLYFLLTGQPPFSGKDPKLIIKSVITEKPKPPDELNPNVPRNVAAIVMKCLEKKQRDRYHGAKQLEADLESVLKSGQMMLKARSFLGKFLGKPPKAP